MRCFSNDRMPARRRHLLLNSYTSSLRFGPTPDSIFFLIFFNAGIPGFCWCVRTCCGNLALAVWTGGYMQECVFVKVCTCVYMCVCVHSGYESEHTRSKHGCLYCRVVQKSSRPYFPPTSPVINKSFAEHHFPQVLFCSHDDLICFYSTSLHDKA